MIIVLIGLIVGLVLPSLVKTRKKTSAQASLNYGRSIGAAFQKYADHHDGIWNVAINDYDDPERIIENVQAAGNQWIRFHLEGTQSNRTAIRMHVEIRSGNGQNVRLGVSSRTLDTSLLPNYHLTCQLLSNGALALWRLWL